MSLEASILRELERRHNYALNLFRPMPGQDPFLTSPHLNEWLLRGGNRCSAEGTVVWKLVGDEYTHVPIESIQAGDYVGAFEDGDRHAISALVERVVTFREAGFRVTTKSGKATTCTHDHPLYTIEGWMKVSDLSVGDCVLTTGGVYDKEVWDDIVSIEETAVVNFIGITTSTGTYIGDGFYSHNSGKSMIAAVRMAAAAMNFRLHDSQGNVIHDDPLCDTKHGRSKIFWCIGLGTDHIGQTFHRLLFEPGQFNTVEVNGRLRAFDPNHDKMAVNKSGSPKTTKHRDGKQYVITEEGFPIIPAPPLIPPEDIKKLAYENAGSRIWSRCELNNGNVLYAFTSNSPDPKMGDPVDGVWIDERVRFPSQYWEWRMRIADREGYIWWSAFPGMKNSCLTALAKRAKEEREHPGTEFTGEIKLTFTGNPYISDKAKKTTLAGMPDEERISRDLGEFAEDHILMYPMFDTSIHGVPRLPKQGDRLSQVLNASNQFVPPSDWCRYLVLDPGHNYTSCLLFAVTPPDDYYDRAVVLYDEVYVRRLSAHQFAAELKRKIKNQFFEAFIIDGRAGRQTAIGREVGDTNERLYMNAFKDNGIKSRSTGYGFRHGSDNVESGCHAVREWMMIREQYGTPTLRVVTDNVPNMLSEIELYQKEMSNEIIMDKPASGQVDHAMDCLRYAAADGLPYFAPPENVTVADSSAYSQFMRLSGANNPKEREQFQCGPGRAA